METPNSENAPQQEETEKQEMKAEEKPRNRFLQLLIDFYNKTDLFYFGMWIAISWYMLDGKNFIALWIIVMLQDIRHKIKMMGIDIDWIDKITWVNLETSKLNIDLLWRVFWKSNFKANGLIKRVQYQGKEYDVIASNIIEETYCIEWDTQDPTVGQTWVRAENCKIIS